MKHKSSIRKKEREEVFTPPLFDRLTLQGTSFLDEEGVKESVYRELNYLFNARLLWKKTDRMEIEKETFQESLYTLPDFFGIEDFSSVSMEDGATWDKLERQIQQACEAYEPRLQNPRVTLQKDDLAFQKLTFQLSGHIKLGNRTIHVTFPLALDMPLEKPNAA